MWYFTKKCHKELTNSEARMFLFVALQLNNFRLKPFTLLTARWLDDILLENDKVKLEVEISTNVSKSLSLNPDAAAVAVKVCSEKWLTRVKAVHPISYVFFDVLWCSFLL